MDRPFHLSRPSRMSRRLPRIELTANKDHRWRQLSNLINCKVPQSRTPRYRTLTQILASALCSHAKCQKRSSMKGCKGARGATIRSGTVELSRDSGLWTWVGGSRVDTREVRLSLSFLGGPELEPVANGTNNPWTATLDHLHTNAKNGSSMSSDLCNKLLVSESMVT